MSKNEIRDKEGSMFKCERCKDTGVCITCNGTGIARVLQWGGICGACQRTGKCNCKAPLLDHQ